MRVSRLKRTAKILSPEEIKSIKNNDGKFTVKELAIELGWNYTSLSTAMNQQKIPFTSKKGIRVNIERDSSAMIKMKNAKGEAIITDDLLKEWSYLL